MWGGVLSLVRQGLRRRRTARVADESAPGGDVPAREAVVPAAAPAGAMLARALLAVARGAVRVDGEGFGFSASGGGGAEEEWAAAAEWRPARAADEVGHLMVRESLRYVIYA